MIKTTGLILSWASRYSFKSLAEISADHLIGIRIVGHMADKRNEVKIKRVSEKGFPNQSFSTALSIVPRT